MKSSKTILAVALLVVLLGSVIPETGVVDLQPATHKTLLAAPLRSMRLFGPYIYVYCIW